MTTKMIFTKYVSNKNQRLNYNSCVGSEMNGPEILGEAETKCHKICAERLLGLLLVVKLDKISDSPGCEAID